MDWFVYECKIELTKVNWVGCLTQNWVDCLTFQTASANLKLE